MRYHEPSPDDTYHSFKFETVNISTAPTLGTLYPDFASTKSREDCIHFSFSCGSCRVYVVCTHAGSFCIESTDVAGIWLVLDDQVDRLARYSVSDDGSVATLFYFGDVFKMDALKMELEKIYDFLLL
jgi:hypothetical protein